MTPDLATWLAGGFVLPGGAGGAWLLWRAWTERGPARPRLILGGWLLFLALVVAPAFVLGGARGPFIAATLISVAALALVARNVQVRQVRDRGEKSLAPEPSDRPSRAWRGVLRALLAGPVGMIAAMGVGIAFAVWAPGAAQTRLVIGGLMVPVLWGGAMAWTLADDKILRALAVLVGVTVVTFAAAILKGFS